MSNVSHAQDLLKFVPEHGRTSCSDENVANYYTTPGRGGYPRCTRCLLLAIISGKIEEDADLGVTFEVQARYVNYPEKENN